MLHSCAPVVPNFSISIYVHLDIVAMAINLLYHKYGWMDVCSPAKTQSPMEALISIELTGYALLLDYQDLSDSSLLHLYQLPCLCLHIDCIR